MSRPLQDQVAIVTGASRGIGRAIAVTLGRLGATVVVNYRSRDDAARAAVDAALAAGAPAARAWSADVSNPEEADALVRGALEDHGRLDVLVNNAGIQRSGMAHRMELEDWNAVVATNLSAAFFTSRAALPAMRAAESGHIVNVASASSYVAQPGACAYVASKHGLIGLTKALALENAGKGVRVNAVAPGLTDTDMVRGLSDDQRSGLSRLVPMGRLGDPNEIAEAVGWLVAHSTYTTGNTLHVSGGVVLG